MADIVSRFAEIMRAEKEVHRALLRLSAEKREAIVGSAVSDLDRIVRAETSEVMQLRDLERRRVALARELAGDQHSEGLSFEDFIIRAESPLKEDLMQLRAELRETLSQLKTHNDVNRRLIESRLDYIHTVTDAMQDGQSSSLYGAGAESLTQRTEPRLLFDQRV